MDLDRDDNCGQKYQISPQANGILLRITGRETCSTPSRKIDLNVTFARWAWSVEAKCMRIFLHLLSVTDFGAYGKHLSRLLSNCLAHMIISRHRQWKSSFSRSVKYGFIFILGGSLFYYYFTISQFDHSYDHFQI